MTAGAGDALRPWRLVVAAEPMRVMADVLADPNPIHLDAEVVRALGLGDRVVNQGPINLAYIVNLLEGIGPGAFVEDLDVRFVANVFDGDTVEAAGVVEAVEGERLRCRIWLDVIPEPGGTADTQARRALEGTVVVRVGG